MFFFLQTRNSFAGLDKRSFQLYVQLIY